MKSFLNWTRDIGANLDLYKSIDLRDSLELRCDPQLPEGVRLDESSGDYVADCCICGTTCIVQSVGSFDCDNHFCGDGDTCRP